MQKLCQSAGHDAGCLRKFRNSSNDGAVMNLIHCILRCVKVSTVGALLVLVAAAPAIAQNLSLTSSADPSGENVYYIGQADYHVHFSWSPAPGFQLNGGIERDLDLTAWASGFNPNTENQAMYLSPLVSFTDAAGRHVYYIDLRQHVNQLFWATAATTPVNQDLTQMTGATLAEGRSLFGFSNGRGQHVYYIGTDAHVHHLWINGGQPVVQDLTTLLGSVSSCASPLLSSSLTGFSDGSGEHVYYEGANQHVCDITGYSVSYWIYNPVLHRYVLVTVWKQTTSDITAAANAVLALQASPLTGFSDSNGEHVYYVGTNQNVYQLFWNGSAESNSDLTLRWDWTPSGWSAIALPVSNGALTSFSNNYGEHVYYVGTDQHVYQINLTTGATLDLSAWYGGPLALNANWVGWNCGSPVSSFSTSTGEKVQYVGADYHVHQFDYLNGASMWVNLDLSQTGSGVPTGECPLL
jgi:hypothetical protein